MSDAMQDAREGVRRAIDQMADACHNATEWNQFPQLGETYLNPAINAVIFARDEQWCVAVGEMARKHDRLCDLTRGEPCDCGAGAHNATLLALLAAMEKPRAS